MVFVQVLLSDSRSGCARASALTITNVALVLILHEEPEENKTHNQSDDRSSGKLRCRRIRRHSLYSFSASPYRARPYSLRASSNMQSAVGSSSPALARSSRSRSCRRSRTESAPAVACSTFPSSALHKGHRRKPSSAGELPGLRPFRGRGKNVHDVNRK